MNNTVCNFIFYSLILGFTFTCEISFSQNLRINEVQSSNTALLDEDGDTPDWIELYNSSNADINLDGYFITDKLDNPTKWRFPNLDINADSYLLLWASKKDRNYILTWRGLVDRGDEFKYLIPNQNVDPSWTSLSFNDNGWNSGRSGFGYGDGDDQTQIPAGTSSVFIRKKFNIEKIESASSILLHIDYDDAFVAYINGVEIARANIQGYPPSYDQFSLTDHEAILYDNGFPEGFFLNNLSDFLVEGENVLAIQGHNVSNNSSDFTLIPFLTASFTEPNESGQEANELLGLNNSDLHTNFKISADGESLYLYDPDTLLVDSIFIPELQPNISYGVNPQTGELEFYETPTPRAINDATAYQGQSEASIQFSHDSGLIDQIALSMSTANDHTIRYTLDATEPDENSTEYIQPISILETSIVRARVFEENFIPSATQTRSYLINVNHSLPIISLVTDPENFFDEENGIYVLGPNDYDGNFPYFGSNFWEDWERPVHFSLFDTENNSGFSIDAGVKVFGGWSRAHEQRSLSIFARKNYGFNEMDYPIFKNRPYEEYQSIVLRNSGNDWLNANMRDGILTSLMEGSGVDNQAYQPAVCYLNGEYWGIYNIREKTNEHLVAAKFNIEPDSIKVLELDGVTSNGELDQEYNQFINFVDQNNLFNSGAYNTVSEQMDIENFIIYNVAQIYFNNTDWPGNNIKFWKSPETKWRWILYDTDFGFGIWNEFDFANNTLNFALTPNGNTWPNPPWSTLLLRKLMLNTSFRNSFVNRFADEMNSRFLPENVIQHIDSIAAISSAEINAHFQRWGGDINWHYQALTNMRNFANQRPQSVKSHILQTLNLPDYHRITCQIDDTELGYIQLNSLSIYEDEWNGDYFEQVPITVEAIPYEGYTFSHWSGSISSMDPTQVIDLQANMTIKANFKESTGVIEEDAFHKIRLYPNPVDSEITIEIDQEILGNLELQLLDQNGRLIKQLLKTKRNAGQKLFTFELTDIAQGKYQILISTENTKKQVLEFVKLK